MLKRKKETILISEVIAALSQITETARESFLTTLPLNTIDKIASFIKIEENKTDKTTIDLIKDKINNTERKHKYKSKLYVRKLDTKTFDWVIEIFQPEKTEKILSKHNYKTVKEAQFFARQHLKTVVDKQFKDKT